MAQLLMKLGSMIKELGEHSIMRMDLGKPGFFDPGH